MPKANGQPVVHAEAAGLSPADAVAAILVHEGGRYILQLRDDRDDIFYPAHWGCFGGAVEDGEDPESAMRRELQEELALAVPSMKWFTRFDFDFATFGRGKVYRIYYEIVISEAAFGGLVLSEGVAVKAFDGEELLDCESVTPYDAFALWMHMNRAKLNVHR